MILLATVLAICIPGRPIVQQPTCVTDGDTFRWQGDRIRIEEIDAPETEQAQCPAERAAGERAKRRLQQLLNAGPIAIQRVGVDRYRRTLARITVNGRNVGQQMIAEGLVRAYNGGRRPWC